jgi:hypothetical protein
MSMKKPIRILSVILILPAAVLYGDPVISPDAVPTRLLEKSADLRPQIKKWGLYPTDQGSRGTCAPCAMTFAVEYAFARKYDVGIKLSAEFLHVAGNRIRGIGLFADAGHSSSELLSAIAKYGVLFDTDMPYKKSIRMYRPPSSMDAPNARRLLPDGITAHWILPDSDHPRHDFGERLKGVLDQGWPVIISGRFNFGFHAMVLVGYRDDAALPGGGEFVIADSAAKGGYKRTTFESIIAKTYEALWVEVAAPPCNESCVLFQSVPDGVERCLNAGPPIVIERKHLDDHNPVMDSPPVDKWDIPLAPDRSPPLEERRAAPHDLNLPEATSLVPPAPRHFETNDAGFGCL